ncbi:MAG: sulfite dehydrogenase, partial [Dechloromonas sp.]|nr:sulfite dehydrogenase [Dechloromonas sp.]
MGDITQQPGRLRHAPENFLSAEQVLAVAAGRRDFLRKSFLAASAAMAAPLAARASQGDPNILNLPAWSTSLGQPVAT